jgi:hypothetical protein
VRAMAVADRRSVLKRDFTGEKVRNVIVGELDLRQPQTDF